MNMLMCLLAKDNIAHVMFQARPNGQARNENIPHFRVCLAFGRCGIGGLLLPLVVKGVVSEEVEAATSSANFSRLAVADSTAAVPSNTL
jgi:hypothetical protein